VNSEHYDKALAEEKNIILLAPHFAALETAGIRLSCKQPVVTMYQYSKNLLVNRMIVKRRPRFEGAIVERKEPLRNLVKFIKKGMPFYYLPDQDAGRKGLFVPFFTEQASTFPMLGKFARLGNAVVIPCTSKLEPWGMGLTISLGEPLADFPSGDDLEDTKRMNQEVEKLIRKLPSQYLWAHKRFKTRPDSDAKFYI
jgi:KDO2-lipid IV(A) lauroyltransferase